MKKYIYKYCVYTNNCCDGVMFLKAFTDLKSALYFKEEHQCVRGCCDVVKKKFFSGADKPITNNIYGLTRYYIEYDL